MKKYLIIGNAESVHLVKWIKELTTYFDVYVISSKGLNTEIQTLLPDSKIFLLNLDISEAGGNTKLFFQYFRIKKIIRRINPDFLNAHYVTSHGFLAALIKKTGKFRFKLIQSAWGTDILVTPFINRLYYRITRFCLDSADLITSDSGFMTEVIKKLSSTSTMTFAFGLDKIPEVDLSKKDSNLFYSNRILSENYNIGEVITFFHRIYKENSSAKLIISNLGEQKKELENKVLKLGLLRSVRFIGFISSTEQFSLYEQAQFYISIPTSDSTSVSLIEALASGCIPVVSDIPANHEWITENINGVIYRKDETSYADLRKILKNKDKIAKHNREMIQNRAIFPDSIKEYVDRITNL